MKIMSYRFFPMVFPLVKTVYNLLQQESRLTAYTHADGMVSEPPHLIA